MGAGCKNRVRPQGGIVANHQTERIGINYRTVERTFEMGWLYLAVAGVCEICWVTGMKLSEGWTRLIPSAVTVVMMGLTYVFLALAVRTIPLGVAYAAWAGFGVLGSALIGTFWFEEPLSPIQWSAVGLITAGIIALRWGTA